MTVLRVPYILVPWVYTKKNHHISNSFFSSFPLLSEQNSAVYHLISNIRNSRNSQILVQFSRWIEFVSYFFQSVNFILFLSLELGCISKIYPDASVYTGMPLKFMLHVVQRDIALSVSVQYIYFFLYNLEHLRRFLVNLRNFLCNLPESVFNNSVISSKLVDKL